MRGHPRTWATLCDASPMDEGEVGEHAPRETRVAQRVAIVTGASSGIGASLAGRLRANGWRVIGLDRVRSADPDSDVVVGDAGDPSAISIALAHAGDRLHGLVCSAAIPPRGPWDDRAAWDELLRVNLSAPYEAFRLCRPALAAAHGSVVFMGSIVGGSEGSRRSPAYAASKAGLEGLARSLALIGAPDRIRVNVLAIGAVDTPFDVPLAPADARPDVPLGRMGSADEIAATAAFLLGDEAAYVTGAVWRVDGGRTVLPGIDVRVGH
jgi:meso-butanediol dehydrogenase/(S,S)-butanediol dehydrogenase/diacetyl reductase